MTMRFVPNEDFEIAAAASTAPTIAVDLDGTLAYHGEREEESGEIGKPIPSMVKRIKEWLAAGYQVVIFTARLGQGDRKKIARQIQNWTQKHIGVRLPVTDKKDSEWESFWDDKAIQMIKNTGESVVENFARR